MDAIKRQASRLREQVAKQQQAILRQLGHLGNEALTIDEAELQSHQQLQNLYKSTRAAKHFQKDIIHGVEGFILTSKKQKEIIRRLVDDCCKYGTENQSSEYPLAMASVHFGASHGLMEEEREIMLKILTDEVSKPLRVLIAAAPLEDARLLTHRYDKLRQEVEAQAAEVMRQQSKIRDPTAESDIKLKTAEARLRELKSSMTALGRESTAAMLSVEDQQQQITLQKLFMMVNAERSYHGNIIAVLEKLHAEMILESQLESSSSDSTSRRRDMHVLPSHDNTTLSGSDALGNADQNGSYFIAKAIHSFDAQLDGELSLEVDDYIVVHQVAPHGWAKGESKGKTGWFPSAYVERQDNNYPESTKSRTNSCHE